MLHWDNFFSMSFQDDYLAFFFPLFFMLCKARPDRKERDLEEYCKCQSLNDNSDWKFILSPHPTKETLKKIRLNIALRETWGTSSPSSLSVILCAREIKWDIPNVVVKTSKMRSNQGHVRIYREKAGVFNVDQWWERSSCGSAEQSWREPFIERAGEVNYLGSWVMF